MQEQHDHRPTYGLDLLEMLVRERDELPEGWVWHRARVLNDGATSISGAVAPVVNGKFERDRLATLDTYIVTRGEADAFAAEWERRTGGCHRCFGEGRVWAGTDKFGATRHSLCPRCGGVSKGKVA